MISGSFPLLGAAQLRPSIAIVRQMSELVREMRRPSTLLTATALSVALAGCVSQDEYDKAVAENESLKHEQMRISEANLFLSAELVAADEEVMQLALARERLADDVQRWAALGAVEMELLRNGLHIILPNDVLFGTGVAELKPDGRKLVGELSKELHAVPYQIVVIGHTDDVPIGPRLVSRYPSNWELAGARASSVVRAMVDEGIPPAQLVAISTGDTQPIASNDTPEGRTRNRRIEVRVRPVIIH